MIMGKVWVQLNGVAYNLGTDADLSSDSEFQRIKTDVDKWVRSDDADAIQRLTVYVDGVAFDLVFRVASITSGMAFMGEGIPKADESVW